MTKFLYSMAGARIFSLFFSSSYIQLNSNKPIRKQKPLLHAKVSAHAQLTQFMGSEDIPSEIPTAIFVFNTVIELGYRYSF